jgi:hypothetical protein
MKPLSFFFVLITVILFTATAFVIIGIVQLQQSSYGSAIEACNLTDTPEIYFSLENPDSYVLQAISNPQTLVFVNPDNTQIDELIQTHGTNTIEYNNIYYQIQFLSVDPGVFGYLGPLMIGWILWGFSVIVAIIFRFSRRHSNKSSKAP